MKIKKVKKQDLDDFFWKTEKKTTYLPSERIV